MFCQLRQFARLGFTLCITSTCRLCQQLNRNVSSVGQCEVYYEANRPRPQQAIRARYFQIFLLRAVESLKRFLFQYIQCDLHCFTYLHCFASIPQYTCFGYAVVVLFSGPTAQARPRTHTQLNIIKGY